MTAATLTRKQQQLSEAVDAAREHLHETQAVLDTVKDREAELWKRAERTNRRRDKRAAIEAADASIAAQNEFQRARRQYEALVGKARAAGLGVEL